jgi:succinate dehydrogenase / fumarate reductase cytochrome b subunit
MASFFRSSIGKKFIQAVSGAFLVIFLLLHGTINFFSVIDSFKGTWGNVDPDKLMSAGDGVFAAGCDFMSTAVITIMVPVLALGILVHIIYGIYLSYLNYEARGGVKRYEVASRARTDSWSSKNMLVLGIVILGIIFFHLTHFWAHMQLMEFTGREAENPYMLLEKTFSSWWVLAIYIIWFCAIFLHLTHGFWSMFQTIGWDNQIWMKRLKVIGVVVAALIWLCFTTVAVNAFLHAQGILPSVL